MAEEWGIPPWEIVQDNRVAWIVRWRIYRDTIAVAQKDKRKHGSQ